MKPDWPDNRKMWFRNQIMQKSWQVFLEQSLPTFDLKKVSMEYAFSRSGGFMCDATSQFDWLNFADRRQDVW